MARLRETVEIDAPAEVVWTTVHEDFKNLKRWMSNMERIEALDGETAVKKGLRLRYHIDLPGGHKVKLDVDHKVVNKPKKCAGDFIGGPLEGTWSYTYTEKDGVTRLVYEMDYNMKGMLRFMTGALAGQYAAGVRDNLHSLKKYIESKKSKKG